MKDEVGSGSVFVVVDASLDDAVTTPRLPSMLSSSSTFHDEALSAVAADAGVLMLLPAPPPPPPRKGKGKGKLRRRKR